MMAPFDGSGGPQQGQPGVGPHMQRGTLPPGLMPGNQSQPMPVGHQHPMNGPYGHRGNGMPGQPSYHHGGMPSQSPSRQGTFNPMPGNGPGGYSSHPPLHSPHQPPLPPQGGPQMHHPMARQAMHHHRNSLGGPSQHGAPVGVSQGMPQGMPQHMQQQQHHVDPMRSSQHSQGGMPRQFMQQPPQQQQQQQQIPQQPPPQQQQHSRPPPPSANSSGTWQSERDTPHRREMIQQIVRILKKDKPGSPESLKRLPEMAKQLEVSLYRDAPSLEAYKSMSTLPSRLKQIAIEVSRKSSRASSQGQGDPHRQQQPPPQQQQHDRQSQGMHNGNQIPVRRSDQAPSPYGHGQMNGDSTIVRSNLSQAGHPPMHPSGIGVAPPLQPPPHYPDQRSTSSMGGRGGGGGGGGAGRRDETNARIRHKQQRLLLLHHSAKCPYEDGTCPVTQHCGDMKRLWRHMEGCTDNQCTVNHCFSSRAILSHYRKCKDKECPACSPVRETVKKSKSQGSRNGFNGQMVHNGGPMMPPGADPLAGSVGGSYGPPNGFNHQPHPAMPPPPHQAGPNDYLMQQQQRDPQPPPPMQHPPQPPPPLQHPPQPPPPMQQPLPVAPPQYHQPPPPPRGRGSFSNPPTAPSPSFGRNGGDYGSQAQGLQQSSSMRSQDGSTSNRPLSKNDPEHQKIRHKQQRLLLLRHASRCPHDANNCTVTPHCANMKRLWEHIAHCKDTQCNVQHCLSSRYVLSHYRRCKDAKCPVCGPVRDMIRKSSSSGGSPSAQNQLPERMSFDHPTSSDVAGPPMSSMSPTPSTNSNYERETKRVRTEQHSSAPDHSVLSAPSPPVVSAPVPPPSPPPPPETKFAPADARNVCKSVPAGKGSTSANTDHSLLNSFTIKQLETHLASLDKTTQLAPAQFKQKCLEVLKGLQTHQHGWVFNCPVDPVELGLTDYFVIIKKPMDLGSVQKKLDNGVYRSLNEFEADVKLTFENAMTYNEKGSVVYDMANELMTKFAADYKTFLAQLRSEDQLRRQNERACVLCGCEQLLFEPPVYFCNGMNCQSQRIRRNSHFYVGGSNQYFWCSSCYNELDGNIPIELVDMSIMKADLTKKKNDEVHEESWVECTSCERWVHQICGLFNTRQNKEKESEYCCPKCLLERRKTTDINPSSRPLCADDLPRTTLSEWLEKHVSKKVERQKQEIAEEKSRTENMTLEEANRMVEGGGPVYIRQVTAMDRKLEVRELMRKRYAHKNYPEEFPFRSKCIVVFQHLDGVDVLLFALYLYEHGEDNPPPNKKVVYISYLDSVHFMRPRKIRTFVYHEILIAYLDYARRRGFETAHIWACPPLKGDDYIFYAKPEDQKTPRDSRLRQWYHDMLVESQKRNIVGKVTNMYDLYFANEDLDATAVPYLEGDYFPGEAENIIKMLEEGGGKKGGGANKKKKSKGSKNKSSTGTRSTGFDEEALIASGIGPSLKDLDRDQVMVKLGETIQPMKESFIVAFLNCPGANEDNMVVPDAIEKARIEYAARSHDDVDMVGSKRDAMGFIRETVSSNPEQKIIDDDAEDLDCEFLNNRQVFLNLCRGNHYQFDEQRRAKHTSMMLLWHLHNRDAPQFVQQCFSCHREIMRGTRYHCNVCSDFDLCQDCNRDPNVNRGACTHQLQAIAVESDAEEEGSSLTEAQRADRQRKLTMHIQLIEHASRCDSLSCSSSNCAKMKEYLKHAGVCKIKVAGGCKICKRIWTLLRIHAQKCKDRNCTIPQCNAIREKMRQLQKQQQAMDDRRRLEMNRHMRFSVTGGAGK